MNIKSFTTNYGQRIEIRKLTVLVGPNNVGKSQTLKDIYRRMSSAENITNVLIENIEFEIPDNFDRLLDGLVVKQDP